MLVIIGVGGSSLESSPKLPNIESSVGMAVALKGVGGGDWGSSSCRKFRMLYY